MPYLQNFGAVAKCGYVSMDSSSNPVDSFDLPTVRT